MSRSDYFRVYGQVRLAPMMGYTTRHMRQLVRLMAPKVLNFTEMVPVNAFIHNPQLHHLGMAPDEAPTALQIGGSDPDCMKDIARHAEQVGFSEINLNVGCPSTRVQQGRFGACLMAEPEIVASMIVVLKAATTLPITVKHRIGLDGNDDYEALKAFVHTLASAGCDGIIVHNRTAFLKGLSPRLNRRVPPLKPQYSHWLKRDFPMLNVCANGEIDTLEKAQIHQQGMSDLPPVDGVMIGRAAWSNPWLLWCISEKEGMMPSNNQRLRVLSAYLEYVYSEHQRGVGLVELVRPLSGFFHGLPHARWWRQAVAQSQINLHQVKTAQNWAEVQLL